MSKDQKQICLFCKWWKANASFPGYEPDENQGGCCRVSSPKIIQWGSLSDCLRSDTAWPGTVGGDFCGKFKERHDTHSEKYTGDWKSIGAIAGDILKQRSDS